MEGFCLYKRALYATFLVMDSLTNFSYGTVLTAPSPATSGTSLVLNSGQGSNFAATPFNAWAWPPNVQPLLSNAEIVRVTNISSDTLTITRAQEGTTARSIAVGWQIAAGLTKKYLDDVEERVRVTTLGWENLPITLTYSSADDPTFIATASDDPRDYLSVGMRLEITQGTIRYFLVTALTETTVTMYGGTDYDLDNAAITVARYSAHKAPHGFPLDPTKWTVAVNDTSDRTQSSPVAGTWYNLGTTNSQITIPIGAWSVSYEVMLSVTKGGNAGTVFSELSTSASSSTDAQLRGANFIDPLNAAIAQSVYCQKHIILASKTLYYLIASFNAVSATALNFRGSSKTTKIRAVSAYL